MNFDAINTGLIGLQKRFYDENILRLIIMLQCLHDKYT